MRPSPSPVQRVCNETGCCAERLEIHRKPDLSLDIMEESCIIKDLIDSGEHYSKPGCLGCIGNFTPLNYMRILIWF